MHFTVGSIVAVALSAASVVLADDPSTAFPTPPQDVIDSFINPPNATYSASAKRDDALFSFGRRTTVDPYAGWKCPGGTPSSVPANPSCSSNNCYRAFLDGRNDSPGLHCPATAFTDCCLWNTLPAAFKGYFAYNGFVQSIAPWTTKCGAGGPFSYPTTQSVLDVVAKIDAVCACTVRHTVTLDVTQPYASLISKNPYDPACVPADD